MRLASRRSRFPLRVLIGFAVSLLIVVCLTLLVYSNRQTLLLRGSSGILHHLTGFRNSVANAQLLPGLLGVVLKDVRMRNPNVFRTMSEFATIKTLLVEFDSPPVAGGRLLLKRLVLDVEAVHVVLLDRGILNLSYLSGMRQKTNLMLGLQSKDESPTKDNCWIFIRRLELRIGKVTYTDTTSRRTAQRIEFPEQRLYVFNDVCGTAEVIRAVCAVVVADRPIPSENLPVYAYVEKFLGKTHTPQTFVTSEEEIQPKVEFNPNQIGKSAAAAEQPPASEGIDLDSSQIPNPTSSAEGSL